MVRWPFLQSQMPYSDSQETSGQSIHYNVSMAWHMDIFVHLIMTWQCFPHQWSFVKGMYRSPVHFPYKGPVMRTFNVSFVVSLNRYLDKPFGRCHVHHKYSKLHRVLCRRRRSNISESISLLKNLDFSNHAISISAIDYPTRGLSIFNNCALCFNANRHSMLLFPLSTYTRTSTHYTTRSMGYVYTRTSTHHTTRSMGYVYTRTSTHYTTWNMGYVDTLTSTHHTTWNMGYVYTRTSTHHTTWNMGYIYTRTSTHHTTWNMGYVDTRTSTHHTTRSMGYVYTRTSTHYTTRSMGYVDTGTSTHYTTRNMGYVYTRTSTHHTTRSMGYVDTRTSTHHTTWNMGYVDTRTSTHHTTRSMGYVDTRTSTHYTTWNMDYVDTRTLTYYTTWDMNFVWDKTLFGILFHAVPLEGMNYEFVWIKKNFRLEGLYVHKPVLGANLESALFKWNEKTVD